MLMLAENMFAYGLMLAGLCLITMILLMNLRRHRRAGGDEHLSPHEKVERIRQTHGVKDDMRQMMVELEEMTRRFGSQLDAKAVRLERLIEEANRRIAALERLDAPAPAPSAPTPARQNGDGEPDELTRRIYQLKDAGRSPVQIAQELDEQVGKVELILALRKR